MLGAISVGGGSFYQSIVAVAIFCDKSSRKLSRQSEIFEAVCGMSDVDQEVTTLATVIREENLLAQAPHLMFSRNGKIFHRNPTSPTAPVPFIARGYTARYGTRSIRNVAVILALQSIHSGSHGIVL